MRPGLVIVLVALGWAGVSTGQTTLPPTPEASFPQAAQKFCLRCHGGDEVEGGFDLTQPLSFRQWEEAFALVEEEQMPDEDPLPSAVERQFLLDWIRDQVRRQAEAEARSVPRFARLTNEEYSNAVRDLTGLNLRPGDWLEPDGEGETGFHNDRLGSMLTPGQIEKYLLAGERIADAVEALRTNEEVRYQWEAEELERSTSHLQSFDEGVLFSVEAQMISTPVHVPVDGFYEVHLRGATMGLPSVVQILDGTQVIATREITEPRPGTHSIRFPIRLHRGWRNLSFNSQNRVPQARLPRDADQVFNEAAARNQMILPLVDGELSEEAEAAGEALSEISFFLQQAFEWLFAYGTGGDPRDIVRFRQYAEERMALTQEALATYRSHLKASQWEQFERGWEERNGKKWDRYEAHLKRIADLKWMDWTRYQGQLYLDSIEIRGPVVPQGTLPRALQTDDPRELAEAMLPRMLRRPVSERELLRYVGANGKDTWVRMLSAPEFLLKDYHAPAEVLSWFLWQTAPDQRLLEGRESLIAGSEKRVRREIRRLMADARYEDGVRSFVGQWLGTYVIGRSHEPDPYRFPSFRLPEREAAREEPVQFWMELIRAKESPVRLLDADFAVVNGALAQFYGWGAKGGEGWQRISLPGGSERGGLLGMSAVLTATSTPVRTNLVARGKWVWETLLGRDAGEPVPDAGILPATAGEQSGLTLREEVDRHRDDPRCSRCHRKLDPIGFALENFDGIGLWREEMAGKPIDSRGTFFRGREFEGPSGLKEELQLRSDEFLRELVRRLADFGSGMRAWDIPEGEIAAEWAERNGTLDELVEEIAWRLVERCRRETESVPSEPSD